MTSPSVQIGTVASKSNTEIRDDILRTVSNGLKLQGIDNPNVGPNSDYYLWATALGNELAVSQANGIISTNDLMPDTAGGDNLDRWLALVKLSRAAATNSFGNITFDISVPSSLVVAGSPLTDNVGLRYQVSVGGTYGAGDQIPIESVDTGAATNHQNGDTLTWVTVPPFSAPTASVGLPGGSDGLTGGRDSEVGIDEPPRSRLFDRLQNPRKGGNASDLIGWAEDSTPDVQSAYAYPALLGPSTSFFLVCGQPQTTLPLTSTSKNRDLPSPLITGTVLPFVLGNMPEHSLCVGASVVNVPIDVAILLSLPSAPTSSPAGPGGGWVDGSPWPRSIGGTAPVVVTSFTNSRIFTVNATTKPTAGVSHVAWLSPLTWTLYSATVTEVTGTSGAYQITIDTPFPGISTGCFIFPLAANTSIYVASLLSAFAGMGPGEWCSPSSSTFKRAFRHPLPSLASPSAMGPQQLKQIIESGEEVLDANYVFTGTASGPTPFNSPSVPTSIVVDPTTELLTSTAPGILVPANLAFYAA